MSPLWSVWRLVAAGVARLEEIDRHWTVSDVLDANEALDAWEDLRPRPSAMHLPMG